MYSLWTPTALVSTTSILHNIGSVTTDTATRTHLFFAKLAQRCALSISYVALKCTIAHFLQENQRNCTPIGCFYCSMWSLCGPHNLWVLCSMFSAKGMRLMPLATHSLATRRSICTRHTTSHNCCIEPASNNVMTYLELTFPADAYMQCLSRALASSLPSFAMHERLTCISD